MTRLSDGEQIIASLIDQAETREIISSNQATALKDELEDLVWQLAHAHGASNPTVETDDRPATDPDHDSRPQPMTRQPITTDRYEQLHDTLIRELTGFLADNNVQLSDHPVDVHLDEFLDHQRWRRHFGTYTAQSIAGEADSTAFNPYDRLDFACPADNIVDQIAFWTVYTDLKTTVENNAEAIETAVNIHRQLNLLVFSTDNNPSDLVSQFFTWTGDRSSPPDTKPVQLDDFNESHVRGRTTIDPLASNVVDKLDEWLADEFDINPETT